MNKQQLCFAAPVLASLMTGCSTTNHTYVGIPLGMDVVMTQDQQVHITGRRNRVIRAESDRATVIPRVEHDASDVSTSTVDLAKRSAAVDMGGSAELSGLLPPAPLAEPAKVETTAADDEPFGQSFWASLLRSVVLACIPAHC